jgi:hypothetical protein
VTNQITAMVCDTGIADPDDDDDQLVFAPPPGLEYASVNDDCLVQGLRIAR